MNHAFNRLELLVGPASVSRLQSARVLLFGVGGVGSWCAEGLVRSGIHHLTIVDSDLVCVTNINRQLQATTQSVGCVKVTELRDRLRQINPDAQIIAEQKIYNRDTAHEFLLNEYDYVIDAIDSLTNKVELIQNSTKAGVTLFSALGASCKLDPTRIQISSIWKSHGCHLGKLVRKRLRRRGFAGDFLCVWSDELLENYESDSTCGTANCVCPKVIKSSDEDAFAHEWCSKKKQINGSAVHITATYGFMLSGLVIQDIAGTLIKPPVNASAAGVIEPSRQESHSM